MQTLLLPCIRPAEIGLKPVLCCIFFLAEGCKVRLGLMKWFRTWFCYALDLFELGEAWCVAHCERMLNIS